MGCNGFKQLLRGITLQINSPQNTSWDCKLQTGDTINTTTSGVENYIEPLPGTSSNPKNHQGFQLELHGNLLPTFMVDMEVSENWRVPPNGWFRMENPLNMDDLGAPTIGNLQVGGNLEVGAKLAAKLAWPSTAKQSLLSSWGWHLVDLVDLVMFPSKMFQNMASMIPVHYSGQIWTDSTWFSDFFY